MLTYALKHGLVNQTSIQALSQETSQTVYYNDHFIETIHFLCPLIACPNNVVTDDDLGPAAWLSSLAVQNIDHDTDSPLQTCHSTYRAVYSVTSRGCQLESTNVTRNG